MPQFDSEPRGTTGTKGHRDLHRFLVDHVGLIVEDEFQVGTYSIDCYAEEAHAGFEYDGKDFHSSTAQKKRDSERDRWILEEFGIPIMRFSDQDLKVRNRETLIAEVMEWLEGHYDGISERRKAGIPHSG